MISIIKRPTTIAVFIIALTVVLAVAPASVNTNSIKAFAWDHHDDLNRDHGIGGHHNFADQEINQEQINH